MTGAGAELSVILATDGLATIEESLSGLRAQTAARRIELVVIAPPGEIAAEAMNRELAGFHSTRLVERDPRISLAAARADGVRAAGSPIVASTETHSFPDPDWAEALIEAHRGPWAAVGPEIDIENPQSVTARAGLILGYAPWLAPAAHGEAEHLPGRNCSYKRSLLLEYEDLDELLDAESLIHWDMRARGHRLLLERSARVRHRSGTAFGAGLLEAYRAGRSFASLRSRAWPRRRRVLYALASPLLPPVRMYRMLTGLRSRGSNIASGAVPALAVMLVASAAGESVGYALGAGEPTRRALAAQELSTNGRS